MSSMVTQTNFRAGRLFTILGQDGVCNFLLSYSASVVSPSDLFYYLFRLFRGHGKGVQRPSEGLPNKNDGLACEASVSVGFRSKERPRNGILPARNWGESQQKKEGVGERKEGNAVFFLPPTPLSFLTW